MRWIASALPTFNVLITLSVRLSESVVQPRCGKGLPFAKNIRRSPTDSDFQVLDTPLRHLIDELLGHLKARNVDANSTEQGRGNTEDTWIAFGVNINHQAGKGNLE